MLLFGHFGQQLDIEEQREELRRLRKQIHTSSNVQSQDTRQAIEMLQQENEELKLYLAALIQHLTAKRVIEPRDFQKLIEQIDQEDGTQDGRRSAPISTE